MSSRLAKGLALAACLSMAATPALAHDRGGWGGGYRGGWGHHHDDGIDAGGIFAGLLVIGAIAAVATAANKSDKDRADMPPPPRPDDRGGHYGQDNSGRDGPRDWGRSRSIDAAVDTCAQEVERGSTRVDSVDGIDRDGDGWKVMGRTRAGAPFRCSIDGDGRLRSMTVDGKAPFNG